MLMPWLKKSSLAIASTRSCRLASLRLVACSRLKLPLRRSRTRFVRLMGNAVSRSSDKTSRLSMPHLHICTKFSVPAASHEHIVQHAVVPELAPEFVQNVTAEIMAGRGDQLPVSAFPVDGTYPVGTSQWEKRNIAQDVPVWEEELCIECGKCMLVCPARNDSR